MKILKIKTILFYEPAENKIFSLLQLNSHVPYPTIKGPYGFRTYLVSMYVYLFIKRLTGFQHFGYAYSYLKYEVPFNRCLKQNKTADF